MNSPTASNYVLGQSDHEYERLMLQARILRRTPKNSSAPPDSPPECECWT